MTKRLSLIVAVALAIVSTAASAQERPRSYDPAKGAPPAAVAAPDAKAQAGAAAANREALIEKAKADAIAKAEQDARAAFAVWKNDKIKCMAEAGLSLDRGEFIFDAVRPLVIQVRNDVWLQPSVYNIPKLKTCR